MSVFLRRLKLGLLFFSLGNFLVGDLFAVPTFPHPASIPEGLGFSIHFYDPLPGEMKMLTESGIRWVRKDLNWQAMEPERGRYDFSAADRLVATLSAHKIRVLFILCFTNSLYDQGKPPNSKEGRQAFAKWVAAAVNHFQGKGILWEMWNEPNLGLFWRPKPSVNDYTLLALEVGKAIQNTAPEEIYLGPALSKLSDADLKFLEGCFKAGLLEYWSAVSVHPYRKEDPETVSQDYERLERLIAKFTPPGRRVPILSAEWGFTTVWRGVDDEKQGKYLARQWLINLMHRIPLSIWHNWRDYGPDPKNEDNRYGIVFRPHYPNRDPAFEPKPAYWAAKTLIQTLSGFRLAKRLAVGGPDDYVLLFKKGEELRLAAWTRRKKPRNILIPANPGLFKSLMHTGEMRKNYLSNYQGLCVTLENGPQYLVPSSSNELLSDSPAWSPTYEMQIKGRERECLITPSK